MLHIHINVNTFTAEKVAMYFPNWYDFIVIFSFKYGCITVRNNNKSHWMPKKVHPQKRKIPPLHRLSARGSLSCIANKGAVK